MTLHRSFLCLVAVPNTIGNTETCLYCVSMSIAPCTPTQQDLTELLAFLEEPPAADGFAEGRRVLYLESWYFSCT